MFKRDLSQFLVAVVVLGVDVSFVLLGVVCGGMDLEGASSC